jgi:REP element-mobilizing transposase RayT
MNPGKNSHLLRKSRVSISGQKYLVTTTTYQREPLFLNPGTANCVLASLHWLDDQKRILLDAAVVMPDHLHCVFELCDGTLARVMQSLKRHTAREINHALNRSIPVWQPQYHDHAIRRDEDYRAVVLYVLNNPVRAGLADDFRAYPHHWCRWKV